MADGSNVQLFPYQSEDLKKIDEFTGRVLLAWEMGLGKTLVSLKYLEKHPEAMPALIVCPASVKFNWAYESNHYIGIRPSICEGQTPPTFDSNQFHQTPKITVCNQDILHYWLPYLKKLKIKTVIVDECQFFIHTTAKRTKALQQITKGKKHVIAASGTPLTNRVSDLWPILNILWPGEFPSQTAYQTRYCNRKWTPWGFDYSGSANTKELNGRLVKLGMLRRRKEDVMKDLPSKVWRTVPCEIDIEIYNEAANDFSNWLIKTGKAKSSKSEKLTRVGHLLRLAAKLKMRSVVDWANQFLGETDQKLIMFAVHKKAIDVLTRRIEFKSTKIDGSVSSMKKRQDAIEQFKLDPDTRLFLGSSAAGTGVNGLQAAASEVGVVEFPYRPADLTQWVDRAHRIGQKSTVFVNLFVAIGTIEEDLVKLLKSKQSVISSVLDGGETEADVNIYEELLAVIEGRLY